MPGLHTSESGEKSEKPPMHSGRTRMRSVRYRYVRIIKVDTKAATVDMSKRKVFHRSPPSVAHVSRFKVSDVEKEEARKRFSKSTVVRKILEAVVAQCGVPMADLFEKVVWTLNRSRGHAFDAFRSSVLLR